MEIFKIIIRLFKKIFHIFQKKESYPESQLTEQENEPSAVIEGGIIEEGTYKGAEKEIKEELIGKQEEKEKQGISEEKGKKEPPIKGTPTEEGIKTERSTYKGQKTGRLMKRELDLGKRRSARRVKKPEKSGTTPKEKREEESPQLFTRVKAPFVEIDLDKAKVFLVIPKQSIKMENSPEKQLSYKVSLSSWDRSRGDSKIEGQLQLIKSNGEYLETEEKRIEIKEAIRNFKITYPEELGGNTYTYTHKNDSIYAFIAVGDNLGKMHYLYDKGGKINPIPRKKIWILLKEDLKINVEPVIEEDRWIWEKYRPLLIDLRDKSELVINEREPILCEPTFSIDSQEVIYDDFSEQSPIFTGNSIKIKAPTINKEGWVVWIQNRQAGYKIVSDDWSGKDPLELRFDNLPCECGEFQVDICEQNGLPVTTLFFRYIPSLQLDYSKELVIPDPKKGHKAEIIEVSLPSKDFKIETTEQIKYTPKGYEISLPPERDFFRFSIYKENKPETKVNFRITVPRLKWNILRPTDWKDIPLCLEREKLLAGEDLYLYINTNSFVKYDILAILETSNKKLQESKFVKKGNIYSILLNQFYDSIKETKDKIMLKIKILKDGKVIGENIPVVYFPKIIPPRPIPRKLRESMVRVRPIVRCGTGMREGRGFSKEEIIQAGIKVEDAKRLNIPYDKHRKSAYPQNVEVLKSLIEGDEHADRSD
jgi:large subunit ribosomal protein L13e